MLSFVMCAKPFVAISVCSGPTCSLVSFSKSLPGTLEALSENVEVDVVGCLGECGAGPNVCVAKNGRVKLVKGVKTGMDALRLLRSYDVNVDTELEGWLVKKSEGDMKFTQGDLKGAVEMYEEVAEGTKKWPVVMRGVLANWARGLVELKQWEMAEMIAGKCIQAGGPGWRWRALALENLGRKEEAVECLQVLHETVAESEKKEVENWRRRLERKGTWFW